MKIRKGDTVKILSGKDRGKRAKILRVLPKERRVIIDGINLKKKHRRSRRQDRKGEIILLPAPMSASAVEIVCPSCGKPARAGYARADAGEKRRICKKCGKEI